MRVFVGIVSALAMQSTLAIAGTAFGGPDCGQWLTPERKLTGKIWVAGYLSGLNSALGGKSDPLGKLNSMEQAYLWIDNFCKANPLLEVQDASNELYRKLVSGNLN